MFSSKAILAALAAFAATAAQAQFMPPPDYEPIRTRPPRSGEAAVGAGAGFHQHDGFYVRLDLSGGYLSSSATQNGVDAKVSGGGPQFGVAVGGAVAENLVLAGHYFGFVVANPSVSAGGTSIGTNDTTWTLFGIGPQLTYYFMPANVYLSGTAALTKIRSSSSGTDADSEWGGGLQLALGKEWWVSDNWGVGFAGQLFASSNKDTGTNAPTISTWGVGVAFSATYN